MSQSSEAFGQPARDDEALLGDLAERETAYGLLQRGQSLMRRRHNAQAVVVLQRAARLEPGKGSIVEALGRACYNSGQHRLRLMPSGCCWTSTRPPRMVTTALARPSSRSAGATRHVPICG